MGAIWIKEKVCFIKFYTWYNIFVELTSSLLTPQNREKKQIAKLQVCSPFKIHHYMYVWLVCETHAKILLSDLETLLMTPCLLSLIMRQSPGRSHGNHQLSQLTGSSRNFLKWLGWLGWSYGNQALYPYLPIINTYSCILTLKAGLSSLIF